MIGERGEEISELARPDYYNPESDCWAAATRELQIPEGVEDITPQLKQMFDLYKWENTCKGAMACETNPANYTKFLRFAYGAYATRFQDVNNMYMKLTQNQEELAELERSNLEVAKHYTPELIREKAAAAANAAITRTQELTAAGKTDSQLVVAYFKTSEPVAKNIDIHNVLPFLAYKDDDKVVFEVLTREKDR